MSPLTSALLVALTLTPVILAEECRPGDNCKEPDCRCWNDPSPPGGYSGQDLPQLVLVSFEYAINSANKDVYQGLFDGIKNPNGCDAKGTFFVQRTNTDFSMVKELYDARHEIGVTTTDGTIPQDTAQWEGSFYLMKAELAQAGVGASSVIGARGPELYNGGDDQFEAMDEVGLTYDSTCTTIEYTERDNLLYPFTYDFPDGTPECTIGRTPEKAFPGKWQFLIADFEFNGQKCASPSACSPQLQTSQDAFDMLFEAFNKHYGGERSPFILYADPLWAMNEEYREGTVQFLQYIRTAFNDTWVVTTQQALSFMRSPVPATNATSFQPFEC